VQLFAALSKGVTENLDTASASDEDRDRTHASQREAHAVLAIAAMIPVVIWVLGRGRLPAIGASISAMVLLAVSREADMAAVDRPHRRHWLRAGVHPGTGHRRRLAHRSLRQHVPAWLPVAAGYRCRL